MKRPVNQEVHCKGLVLNFVQSALSECEFFLRTALQTREDVKPAAEELLEVKKLQAQVLCEEPITKEEFITLAAFARTSDELCFVAEIILSDATHFTFI